MMVGSYFIGQKHYPIDYFLKKALGYLGLAVTLYFFSNLLDLRVSYVRLIVHSVFILIFLVLVYKVEQPKFLKFSFFKHEN